MDLIACWLVGLEVYPEPPVIRAVDVAAGSHVHKIRREERMALIPRVVHRGAYE